MASKKSEKEQERSGVIQLLDLVYKNSLCGVNHSWERLNKAMRLSLKTAIGSGFEFDIDDWQYIGSHYRSGYWLGDDIEHWYAICVSDDNATAIASYEKWKNREACIADDVTPIKSDIAHMTGTRNLCRLAVGSEFAWKGKKVTVTSFGDGYLVACSYKPRERHPDPSEEVQKAMAVVRQSVRWINDPHDYSNKIEKRFKITRQDIIDDRAARKQATKNAAKDQAS